MTFEAPVKIVIDYLDGVTRRSDAVAYARGFIASHFDVPALSGYYVHKMPGGFAFEIHEGGSGRAYLPKVLRLLNENPTQTITIRGNNRLLQVSRTLNEGFNAILLPEELSEYVGNVIDPDENAPRLIPYQQPGSIYILIGLPIFLLGLTLMVSGLVTFSLDRVRPKEVHVVTPYEALPLSQWNNFAEKVDSQHYIKKMQWQNGNWQIDTETVNKHTEKPAEPERIVVPSQLATAPALPNAPTAAASNTAVPTPPATSPIPGAP